MFRPVTQEEFSDQSKESRWDMASHVVPTLQGLCDALQQHVSDQSEKHMNLGTNLRAGQEAHATQRTLQKTEEKLNGPSRAVQSCNGCGCKVHPTCQEVHHLAFFRPERHEAQVVDHLSSSSPETDDLIGDYAELSMPAFDALPLDDAVRRVALEAGDEEDLKVDHVIEKRVVVVGSVDKVGPALLQEDLKVLAIMDPGSRERNLLGDALGEIEGEVCLASVDSLAVLRPQLRRSAVQNCGIYGREVAELCKLTGQLFGESDQEVLKDVSQNPQPHGAVHGVREGAAGDTADSQGLNAIGLLDRGAHRRETKEVVEEPAENHGKDRELGEPFPFLLPVDGLRHCLLERPKQFSQHGIGGPCTPGASSRLALSMKLRLATVVPPWTANLLARPFSRFLRNVLELARSMNDTGGTHCLSPSDKRGVKAFIGRDRLFYLCFSDQK